MKSLLSLSVLFLLLLSVISLSRGADLSLGLREGATQQAVSLDTGSTGSRTIELVQDRSYRITCTSRSGGFQQSEVWFRDDTAVEIRVAGNETADGVQAVYAIGGSNSHDLVLNVFGSQATGQYSCRRQDEQVTLDIGIGNPVVIAASPELSLNAGFQPDSITQTLSVLYSGDPQPDPSQVTWSFNGVLTIVTGRRYQLNDFITSDDAGVYECNVTTNVGTATATFTVIVNVQPEVMLTPSDTQTVVEGSPLVLTCTDTAGMPPPTFLWQRGDQEITDDGDRVRITESSNPPSSTLNIIAIQPGENGSYYCSGQNDAGNSNSPPVTVNVLSLPAPPTNITSTPLDNSPCRVLTQWSNPPFQPFVVPANFTIIEAFVGGEWRELTRVMAGLEEVEVKIPADRVDTRYRLRGRGLSDLPGIGAGRNEESSEEYTAYQTDTFPDLVDLNGSPATPTSIRLTWDFPQQDCFVFTSHALSCSRNGQGPTLALVAGPNRTGEVEGLMTDALYNCSVSSMIIDAPGQSFQHTIQSNVVLTFTYPNPPPIPDPPRVNASSPVTITVVFSLPDNHEEISHYQVIVLRLATPSSLPSSTPDQLYPAGYSFDTHANVHRSDRDEYSPYIAAEIAGSLFKPEFTLGNGLRTNGSGIIYRNDLLAPGSAYTCFLRAFPETFYNRVFRRKRAVDPPRQYDVFSSSGFLPVQRTQVAAMPDMLGLVIGVCLAGLLVLILCIVVVIVAICCLRSRRRREYKMSHKAQVDVTPSESLDGTPQYQPTPDLGGRKTNGIELKQIGMINPIGNGSMYEPSGPVTEEEFPVHVERFDANRQLLFQEEFEWISTNSSWHPAEASNHPLNDEKNRYHNITAFDHTRVKLSTEIGVECSDYINANYILGYSGDSEYIATQGPLEQTVVEFWKMVWEQNTSTIVMLTNLVELGKVKCTQYWPVNGTVIYGGVKVTLESVVELPDYTIRNLNVSSVMSSNSRMVLQFQFTRWPDYGVPKLAAPLLNFLRAVNASNPSGVGPVVIHCSAGVGRSGTVIAIDYCLKQLKADGYMDPCGFVQQLRNQRNYMVQTEQQYTFLHFALLEAITYGDTSFEMGGFGDSYQSLNEVNPSTGQSHLEEEYGRIGSVKTMTKKSSFQQKIKQKGAPPRHFNSSFMGSIQGSGSVTLENFSAHYMDTYSETRRLVVADGPTDDFAAKWWQMVWDEDIAYIVNLTPQDEKMFQYWPENGSVQHGGIVVEVEDQTAEHLYTLRKIKLTNAKVDGISHSVQQYHFIGWPTECMPRVPDFVRFVCDIMEGMDTLRKNQKILLHDIDSLGPCGVMCSLYSCVQRLQKERIVDVFQAVQLMKLQRPGSVTTVQEYAFIYDCVFEFIRTHSNSESQI